MRFTVLGASGGIGRELVRQGLAAGHEVTAVVRDSARSAVAVRDWERVPAGAPARLRVAVVDELTAPALAGAVARSDAVASALGPRGRSTDPTVNSAGVAAAVAALRAAGGRRIVAVSAAPLFRGGPLLYRRVARPLLWAAFGAHYRDLERMEQVLRESGLDWTAVRPPRLTDGPGTGRPALVPDGPPPGRTVARADVATAILRTFADPATIGRAVGVGHP